MSVFVYKVACGNLQANGYFLVLATVENVAQWTSAAVQWGGFASYLVGLALKERSWVAT